MAKQLIFDAAPPLAYTFENFYAGSNAAALEILKHHSQQTTIFCAYLWGAKGGGKTHLLRALCSSFDANISAYLSLQNNSPQILEEIMSHDLIIIDDIDLIRQNVFWEEALFHLYNRVESQNGHLVFASSLSPHQLDIQLPDLKSRIAASFVIELKPLSDDEKLCILKMRALERGFDLSEDVMAFLITHLPRAMNELIDILYQLDTASLREKRRITVPFVRDFLKSRGCS